MEDVFLVDEGHFTVNLRKLRLSVCTQILITEAFDNLKIAVKAADHQELLEGLWRLWQGVKFSWIHTARHHKITCSFWS